jgi:NAD(P)-dependent dehydrogenase (short-subunit alcohol dehydrogenase family)
MCNAGVMALPASTSADGYEIQFATNHLGHALLIKLLLPTLIATAEQGADVRIINLTSTAHGSAHGAKGIEFATLKSAQSHIGPFFGPSKWVRYAQSKLANLLYAQELSRRYPSILSTAVHPGFIKTELHGTENFIDRQLVNYFSGGNWIDVVKGPYTQIWAATAPKDVVKSGAYYEPVGVEIPPRHKSAEGVEVAGELWEWTDKALSEFTV